MSTTGNVIIGFNLICLSALAGGTFALLLDKMRTYKLEHMWSLSFMIGYLLLPLGILSLAVPEWPMLLRSLQGSIIPIVAMGLGWGIASLFFVNGIKNMGLSSGYAIIFGVAIALGSSIPLVRRWGIISSSSRIVILLGICICIAGVVLSSIAAGRKETGQGSDVVGKLINRQNGKLVTPIKGIAGCVVSGALSACANIGFDLTEPILLNAQKIGVPAIWTSIVRWMPLYFSGFTIVLCYSLIKITRDRSWHCFIKPGSWKDLLTVLIIAVLLTTGQIPYGAGTFYLGKLGTSVGWAVYMSLSVVVANIAGFIRGEWKSAQRGPFLMLIGGICVLIAGVIVIAFGNSVSMRV